MAVVELRPVMIFLKALQRRLPRANYVILGKGPSIRKFYESELRDDDYVIALNDAHLKSPERANMVHLRDFEAFIRCIPLYRDHQTLMLANPMRINGQYMECDTEDLLRRCGLHNKANYCFYPSRVMLDNDCSHEIMIDLLGASGVAKVTLYGVDGGTGLGQDVKYTQYARLEKQRDYTDGFKRLPELAKKWGMVINRHRLSTNTLNVMRGLPASSKSHPNTSRLPVSYGRS